MERYRSKSSRCVIGKVVPFLGACLALMGGWRLAAQPQPAPFPSPDLGALLGDPIPAGSEPVTKPIIPAAQRPPSAEAERDEAQIFHPLLRLDLPGQQILFRLESEEQLRERLRQEAKQRAGGISRGRLEFPDDRMILTRDTYQPRYWPAQAEVVEPYYVAYRRLYFNQINSTRYGWDYGVLAPFITTATFWVDFASMPYQLLSEPCRRFEYNTGYPLPGDPVPLLLYPPKLK